MIDPSAGARLRRFFAVDDPWERPGGLGRSDVLIGLATLAVSVVTFELVRSAGVLQTVRQPSGVQWLAVVVGGSLLVARRRLPLTVAALAAVHLFVVGVTMPEVTAQFSMQVVYFVAFFSGVAWARSRRDMLVVVGAIVVFMFAWLAWHFVFGSGIDQIRRGLEEDADRSWGLISPVAAGVLLSALVNVVFFGGAVLAGQVAWRGARQAARLAEQAELLRTQGERLQQAAVVAERLRIARELHDVVAHHVSVIGINAAAARRVLDRAPARAGQALGQIEESSREAVVQMRGLLGTLRAPVDDSGDDPRTPGPGLADLPGLVQGFDAPGLTATFRLVEEPDGAAATLPSALGLTIYRIAQEALSNVRRHSAASRVTVVVRVDRRPGHGDGHGHAELEVTDDGRPRHDTSGSGLGHLGIRERATSHHGQVEIGPRVSGGYRVRVRLPLATGTAVDADAVQLPGDAVRLPVEGHR
jgi:signal transduction histidine kinase